MDVRDMEIVDAAIGHCVLRVERKLGRLHATASTSAAASGVKRISSSPGVVCEWISAKGGSSALISENSEQISH